MQTDRKGDRTGEGRESLNSQGQICTPIRKKTDHLPNKLLTMNNYSFTRYTCQHSDIPRQRALAELCNNTDWRSISNRATSVYRQYTNVFVLTTLLAYKLNAFARVNIHIVGHGVILAYGKISVSGDSEQAPLCTPPTSCMFCFTLNYLSPRLVTGRRGGEGDGLPTCL